MDSCLTHFKCQKYFSLSNAFYLYLENTFIQQQQGKIIGEHSINGNKWQDLGYWQTICYFLWGKVTILDDIISTKRLTALREQMHFIHHLPEYSEILSMSKSHSQMEQMSPPTEPGLQVPRFPETHTFPFSKHHAQSRHLLSFVGPTRG